MTSLSRLANLRIFVFCTMLIPVVATPGCRTTNSLAKAKDSFSWPDRSISIKFINGSESVTRNCDYLGHGNYGSVYKFKDEQNRDKVIKVPADPRAPSDEFWWEAEVFIELRAKLLQEDSSLRQLADYLLPATLQKLSYNGIEFQAMIKDFIPGQPFLQYGAKPDGAEAEFDKLYPLYRDGYKAGYVISDARLPNFMWDAANKKLWLVDAHNLSYVGKVKSFREHVFPYFWCTNSKPDRLKNDPEGLALEQPAKRIKIDPAFAAIERAAGHTPDGDLPDSSAIQDRDSDDVSDRAAAPRSVDSPNAARSGQQDNANDANGGGKGVEADPKR